MSTAQQQRCANCGAMMTPQTDGRTLSCPYCAAQVQTTIDSQQLANGLKLDLANADEFLHQLASSLHTHLGTRTKVLLEGTRVIHFEINLDPDLFVARRESSGVIAQYKKLVRGIALKTHTHPLDKWVELLTKALAAHANENARVAQVLSQLKP
jgi:predicted RNA-binding Zn-ribbon protein involved in translation (DUF1610 family)